MESVSAYCGTIDEQIRAVFLDTKRVIPIETGSDAFLDIVLEETKWLEGCTRRLESLNNTLIECFTKEPQVILRLLPETKELHQSLLRVLDGFEKGRYAKALKTAISLSRIEARQLREIIDDVNLKAEIDADSELQSLFSQL